MISFTRFGRHGWLGNQLFQYAALKALSLSRGFELRLPAWHKPAFFEWFDVPERLLETLPPFSHTYVEREFPVNPEFFRAPDDTNFFGYFQSEKYFLDHAEEIRASLRFKPWITEKPLGVPGVTVSVHCRRGNYLERQGFHPVCGVEYFASAFRYMSDALGSDITFVMFSDDPEWCRKNVTDERVIFVEDVDGVDLWLMSQCDHHIIANSSFSWWGAWLNPSPDKIVVAPTPWFGPASSYDTRDLLPSSWTVLPNRPPRV